MTKEFNSLDEIQQYYDEKSNTYIFKENKNYIEKIVFNFDLDVEANIDASDINARDIKAYNITSYDINAKNIKAWNMYVWNINADDIFSDNIDLFTYIWFCVYLGQNF